MSGVTSFSVDHDLLVPGIYLSRIDGDISTYDLRTRRPNADDYMDSLTMHSLEHMAAAFLRSGALTQSIIYFGPMGCQTGFYLLVRNAQNERVLEAVKEALRLTVSARSMFGGGRSECGNYKNLSLEAAASEARSFLSVLEKGAADFEYPK